MTSIALGIGLGLMFGLKLSGSCSMGIDTGRRSSVDGGFVGWSDDFEYLSM